jgi:hypothetical protein
MLVVLVVPEGYFELVFKDDDAAGRGHVGALVAHLAGPGGEPDLVAGVAAVPASGTERGDQLRLTEAAQESGEQPMISAARPIVYAG